MLLPITIAFEKCIKTPTPHLTRTQQKCAYNTYLRLVDARYFM